MENMGSLQNNLRMDIVACTDKWYVMPTGVMIYSVKLCV